MDLSWLLRVFERLQPLKAKNLRLVQGIQVHITGWSGVEIRGRSGKTKFVGASALGSVLLEGLWGKLRLILRVLSPWLDDLATILFEVEVPNLQGRKKKTLFNAKIQALSNVSIVQGLDKNQNKYSAKTAMSKRHESDSCQLKFRSFNDQQISPYPRDQITLSDDD